MGSQCLTYSQRQPEVDTETEAEQEPGAEPELETRMRLARTLWAASFTAVHMRTAVAW